MEELKPCPFCGCSGTSWKDHKSDCYFVLWIEDSMSLNVPRELLNKAWNTRAKVLS